MHNDDQGEVLVVKDAIHHGRQQIEDYPYGEGGVELLKNAMEASAPDYHPYIGYCTSDYLHEIIKASNLPEEMKSRSEGSKVFIANNGAIDLIHHLDFHATGKEIGFKANQNHGSGSKKAGLKNNECLKYWSFKDDELKMCIIYRDNENTPKKLEIVPVAREYHLKVIKGLGLEDVVETLGPEWTVVFMSGPRMETDCLSYRRKDNSKIAYMTIAGYEQDSMVNLRAYFESRFTRFESGGKKFTPRLATARQTTKETDGHSCLGLVDQAKKSEKKMQGAKVYEFEVPKDPRIDKVYVIYNPKRKDIKKNPRCLEQIDGQLCSGFVSQNVVQNRYNRREMASRIREFGINNDHSSWVVLVELSNDCQGTVTRTSHRYQGVSVNFDDPLLVQNIKNAFPQELRDKIDETKVTGLLDNDGLNARIKKMMEQFKPLKDVLNVVPANNGGGVNPNPNPNPTPPNPNPNPNPNPTPPNPNPPPNPFEKVKKVNGYFNEKNFYNDQPKEEAENLGIWDTFVVDYCNSEGYIDFCSTSPAFKRLVLDPLYQDPDMKKLISRCENADEIIAQEFIFFVWRRIAASKSLTKDDDLNVGKTEVKALLTKESLSGIFLPFPVELKKSVRSVLKKDQDLNLNTNQEEN